MASKSGKDKKSPDKAKIEPDESIKKTSSKAKKQMEEDDDDFDEDDETETPATKSKAASSSKKKAADDDDDDDDVDDEVDDWDKVEEEENGIPISRSLMFPSQKLKKRREKRGLRKRTILRWMMNLKTWIFLTRVTTMTKRMISKNFSII